MVRRYFRLRRLILAGLAFAAIAVPVAQAKDGEPGFWTERPTVTLPTPSQPGPPASSEVGARVRASASNGFDWTDAGIGAAVVFGAATVVLGAVAAGRRNRSRPVRLANA